MKAASFKEFGGPEVLQLRDMPDPVARRGEVRISVHAASINGADYKVRRGFGVTPAALRFSWRDIWAPG